MNEQKKPSFTDFMTELAMKQVKEKKEKKELTFTDIITNLAI